MSRQRTYDERGEPTPLPDDGIRCVLLTCPTCGTAFLADVDVRENHCPGPAGEKCGTFLLRLGRHLAKWITAIG